MHRVALIQARATSTRLPAKVLADIEGVPLLGRELERLRRAQRVDDIVVATTTNRDDDAVVRVADAAGARWFRGSETDVLARLAGAAREARADLVVRVCADCPLLDGAVVDRAVARLEATDAPLAEYVSTDPPRTFPLGLDVEALYADVLLRVDRVARSAQAREHVTFFIYGEAPELFLRATVFDSEDNSDQRWTVDTAEDLAFVRALYAALGLASEAVPYRDVARYVRAHPELMELNRHVRQRVPGSTP